MFFCSSFTVSIIALFLRSSLSDTDINAPFMLVLPGDILEGDGLEFATIGFVLQGDGDGFIALVEDLGQTEPYESVGNNRARRPCCRDRAAADRAGWHPYDGRD